MNREKHNLKKRNQKKQFTLGVCEGGSERKDKSGELVKPFKGVIFLTDIIGKNVNFGIQQQRLFPLIKEKQKYCLTVVIPLSNSS